MTISARDEMIEEIQSRLGVGMIDIELDPRHYQTAVNRALRRYRQRSTNAQQEAFVFLEVQKDESTYTLASEIQEVTAVYRRNLGGGGNSGAALDPFSLSFANNIYLMQNPGNISTGGAGTLASYDLAVGFQKLAGRMFGLDVQYTWNASTKKIMFHRKFTGTEEVGLHVYMARTEDELINDPYARPWIEDYSLANCKFMLGEARSLFSQLAGPQGGVTMNGEAMKTEATAEMERLDKELQDGAEGSMGYSFVIG